jgi:hypothetical protein
MSRDLKIENVKHRIEDLQKALEMMPKDTVLGRKCIEAYLHSAEKKLKKLLEEN